MHAHCEREVKNIYTVIRSHSGYYIHSSSPTAVHKASRFHSISFEFMTGGKKQRSVKFTVIFIYFLHRCVCVCVCVCVLQQLKWSTLQHRRRTIRLTMLYKYTTGKRAWGDLKFQPASGRRSHHSRQVPKLQLPHRLQKQHLLSSPAQSGTETNSPQMQFCPPLLAPSSRRCHLPPSKFIPKFFSFFSFLFLSLLSFVSTSFCLYHC